MRYDLLHLDAASWCMQAPVLPAAPNRTKLQVVVGYDPLAIGDKAPKPYELAGYDPLVEYIAYSIALQR